MSDRRRGVVAAAGLGVGVTIVLLVVFASRFGSDPALTASPLIGTKVTDRDIALLEGDGAFSLADFEGSVVVVNFWASWCLPCRSEHPILVAASTNYGDVEFVGILYQDAEERGVAFLDELGRGADYVYGLDPDSRVALDFGIFGLPETFFVDASGNIVGKVNGPIDYPLLAATLDTILTGGTVESVTTGKVQQAPDG